MALASKGIFIIAAKRTPFCHYGGPLRESPASLVFAAAAKKAMLSANLDPTAIDNTVVGNVFFLSQCDGGKNARYCALYSGVPIERPALSVNKAYGTGIQAVISAALDISTGLSNITLTGGAEIMSSLPLLVRNVRFGTALGSSYRFEDPMKTKFVDSYTGLSLQRIAENLANQFDLSRGAVDEYAWHSHLKWKAAQESKIFDSEIAPISVKLKKRDVLLDKDILRTESTQGLQHLKTAQAILENDGHIVTEGNSSTPGDGAAAIILSDESSLHAHNTTPLARVIGWATVGVNPKTGDLAVVEAVTKLVDATGVKLDDIDLFEINEKFASETLVTMNILNIDPSKVNINGGAIALGDPVAATGARMITHLVHQLRQKGLKRGIAVSNCGAGQGVALLLESNK